MKSAIRRPVLAPIGLILCLSVSLAFVSCREERESSQQALRKLGYHFTADDFLRAAAAGDQPAVEQFLEYRMPIEMADTNGDTALIHAAANGHTGLSLHLIELGAEVNRAGKYQRTALMRAAENGHAETVKLLLDANADPNTKDTKEWSALTLAVYGGHSRASTWLAKRSKNHLDAAVLVAAIQGNPEIVELLIESGAIVETRNASGQTPLMLAARNGHRDAVEKLVRNGANPFAQDPDGSTPADHATQKGHLEVADLLTQRLDPSANVKARSQPRHLLATAAPALTSPPTSLTPVAGQPARVGQQSLDGRLLEVPADLIDDELGEYFELRNFVDDPLPLALVAAQIGQATVRVLHGSGGQLIVQEGQIIGDTSMQVMSITPRLARTREGGPMIDASEMEIRQLPGGARHTLVSGTSAQGSQAKAVLGYEGSGKIEFGAQRGDEFQIRRAGIAMTYRVTSVGPAQVMLENLKSHQIITIRRHDRPADRL